MVVTLTERERDRAIEVAEIRTEATRSTPALYGVAFEDQPELRRLGAAGEAAVAKGLDRAWRAEVFDGDGDVHGGLFVRATRNAHGSLILHPEDVDDAAHVLAIAERDDLTRFRLAGWKWGADGKHPSFWRTEGVRHPAFFVPQHLLEPLESIREVVLV